MSKLKVSKTKQELLNNTIAFYSEDVTRRAYDEEGGQCMYYTKDGRTCAIGRELKSPSTFGVKSGETDGSIGSPALMGELPKRLRDMGASFLDDIQGLHDSERYWNIPESKLSDKGRIRVRDICNVYDLISPLS
jgi:hypothetical protein|tara:strand:- start:1854 stop:2255 length:402 start_codon:yes stop_codon:yes gene_type:complete